MSAAASSEWKFVVFFAIIVQKMFWYSSNRRKAIQAYLRFATGEIQISKELLNAAWSGYNVTSKYDELTSFENLQGV